MSKLPFERRDFVKTVGGSVLCAVGASQIGVGQESQSEPEFHWRFESDSERLTPWRSTGQAVLASGAGTVFSIDLETGAENWTFDTGIDGFDSVVTTLPELGTAHVNAGGTVYAIDIETGREEWSVNVGDRFASYAQSLDEANLLFLTADDEVVALDATDGSETWTVEDSGAQFITIRLVPPWGTDGDEPLLLMAGTETRGLMPTTGVEQWAFDPGDNPTITFPRDGISGIRTDSSTVLGVDITTGTQLWEFDTGFDGRPRYMSSGVSSLYVVDEGMTYSVDAATGEEQWRFEHDGGSHVIAQEYNVSNRAYITAPDAVYAVDSATGDELWRFETTTETARTTDVTQSPANRLYISDDGVVHKVAPETGESRWAYDTGIVDFPPGRFRFVTGPRAGESTPVGLIEAGSTLYRVKLPASEAPGANSVELNDLTGEDITVEFTNNFFTERTETFLGGLFNEVRQGLPVSDPTLPDENEAYINVDMRVELPESVADSVSAVRPRFTHDQTNATFAPDNLAHLADATGIDYAGRGRELARLEPSVYGWNEFRLRTPTQVGISFLEGALVALSAGLGAGEVTSPVEANTEEYPDVFLTELEIEGVDGETVTVDVDERLPRYDDVCTDVGLTGVVNPDCPVDGVSQFGTGVVVFSPATVAVEDDEGRITGRVWEGNELVEYDEIPGALYSGPIRHEFVLAPEGDHRIIVDGTAEGTATVEVDEIDGDEITTTTYGDVEVDPETRLRREADATDMAVDVGRNGESDSTLAPAASVERPAGLYFNARTETAPREEDIEDTAVEDLAGFGIATTIAGLGGAAYTLKRLSEDSSDNSE